MADAGKRRKLKRANKASSPSSHSSSSSEEEEEDSDFQPARHAFKKPQQRNIGPSYAPLIDPSSDEEPHRSRAKRHNNKNTTNNNRGRMVEEIQSDFTASDDGAEQEQIEHLQQNHQQDGDLDLSSDKSDSSFECEEGKGAKKNNKKKNNKATGEGQKKKNSKKTTASSAARGKRKGYVPTESQPLMDMFLSVPSSKSTTPRLPQTGPRMRNAKPRSFVSEEEGGTIVHLLSDDEEQQANFRPPPSPPPPVLEEIESEDNYPPSKNTTRSTRLRKRERQKESSEEVEFKRAIEESMKETHHSLDEDLEAAITASLNEEVFMHPDPELDTTDGDHVNEPERSATPLLPLVLEPMVSSRLERVPSLSRNASSSLTRIPSAPVLSREASNSQSCFLIESQGYNGVFEPCAPEIKDDDIFFDDERSVNSTMIRGKTVILSLREVPSGDKGSKKKKGGAPAGSSSSTSSLRRNGSLKGNVASSSTTLNAISDWAISLVTSDSDWEGEAFLRPSSSVDLSASELLDGALDIGEFKRLLHLHSKRCVSILASLSGFLSSAKQHESMARIIDEILGSLSCARHGEPASDLLSQRGFVQRLNALFEGIRTHILSLPKRPSLSPFASESTSKFFKGPNHSTMVSSSTTGQRQRPLNSSSLPSEPDSEPESLSAEILHRPPSPDLRERANKKIRHSPPKTTVEQFSRLGDTLGANLKRKVETVQQDHGPPSSPSNQQVESQPYVRKNKFFKLDDDSADDSAHPFFEEPSMAETLNEVELCTQPSPEPHHSPPQGTSSLIKSNPSLLLHTKGLPQQQAIGLHSEDDEDDDIAITHVTGSLILPSSSLMPSLVQANNQGMKVSSSPGRLSPSPDPESIETQEIEKRPPSPTFHSNRHPGPSRVVIPSQPSRSASHQVTHPLAHHSPSGLSKLSHSNSGPNLSNLFDEEDSIADTYLHLSTPTTKSKASAKIHGGTRVVTPHEGNEIEVVSSKPKFTPIPIRPPSPPNQRYQSKLKRFEAPIAPHHVSFQNNSSTSNPQNQYRHPRGRGEFEEYETYHEGEGRADNEDDEYYPGGDAEFNEYETQGNDWSEPQDSLGGFAQLDRAMKPSGSFDFESQFGSNKSSSKKTPAGKYSSYHSTFQSKNNRRATPGYNKSNWGSKKRWYKKK